MNETKIKAMRRQMKKRHHGNNKIENELMMINKERRSRMMLEIMKS
jgi:hypothetical protein